MAIEKIKTKDDKRREEIVDIGLKIIHLWLDNIFMDLPWVIENLDKKQEG